MPKRLTMDDLDQGDIDAIKIGLGTGDGVPEFSFERDGRDIVIRWNDGKAPEGVDTAEDDEGFTVSWIENFFSRDDDRFTA